ncbi:MAG: alkaline phosphatase family protein [Vicinamibacteria bacterium]|nr:alkaline phosphatase family protein [Vicinamibacteria bacterium]
MRLSALLTCETLALSLLSGPAHAQPAKPALVVVVVVDQMRRDYIQDYGQKWTKGLRRLVDQGAWFTNAAYPYTTTLTCPGHATISTGTLPSTHGIISNQWWDRAAQRAVSCTHDANAREVPYGARPAGSGGSARLLGAPTLAAAIGQPGGRVVTMSLKRAAAAMLAGQGRADAVLWFQGGGWSSSTAWASAPEQSVLRSAERAPVEDDFGRSWDRLAKRSDYKFDDKGVGERPLSEWDVEMPHALQPRDGKATTFFYEAWQESPYSDAALGRLASAAIDGMKLGQGSTTDFLAVSFSALDIVGHDFGPRSHEIQDVLLRLDDVVGKLLDQLDKRVGRDKYVLAFTADHGVAVIPEQAASDRLDAGRIKMGDITDLVNKVVGGTLGAGRWVAMQAYSEFYFRGPVFEKIAENAALLASIKTAIGEVPGIARVYDRREVAALAASDDPVAREVAAGFFPARSGDLIIVPKPNWIFVSDDKSVIPGNATTHGTGYAYDTQVPLILIGAGISPGHYEAAASPVDIAPTLAKLAGVALPTATGRTLDEALKK